MWQGTVTLGLTQDLFTTERPRDMYVCMQCPSPPPRPRLTPKLRGLKGPTGPPMGEGARN
jgi:hypothetical protein